MNPEDLDNAMEVQEAYEARETGGSATSAHAPRAKRLIGTVEHFFDKIEVVAIKLDAELKVGDMIEIGDEESSVRQRISSMQIDRVDVELAGAGDAVGIKLNHKVHPGTNVYRLG
ncbi:MAG: hypothetical protein KGH61_04575 [Candidatus Micrarchaeota archaeon]|nr:hypothetical protein [Candidatus Micrarchaeota archaeon]MDE1848192.1 hypothetical protein [Candidatus Micrarchaeota archaeon]MDE1864840.1 hypothetical protein [Candidatus Micrarchaeota archaeon]